MRRRASSEEFEPDSRGSSVVPDSQPNSEPETEDSDYEPWPRAGPSRLSKGKSRAWSARPPPPRPRKEVTEFVHRKPCRFQLWSTEYRYIRYYTRGPAELKEPLRISSIRPTLGDLWIHERASPSPDSEAKLQYWIFKEFQGQTFWKEVWPGIGDWVERHPHPGCEYVKLAWRQEKFRGAKSTFPVWKPLKVQSKELSKGYLARRPLEIVQTREASPALEYSDYIVPESSEDSEIEYLGTFKPGESKTFPKPPPRLSFRMLFSPILNDDDEFFNSTSSIDPRATDFEHSVAIPSKRAGPEPRSVCPPSINLTRPDSSTTLSTSIISQPLLFIPSPIQHTGHLSTLTKRKSYVLWADSRRTSTSAKK
ncbi:hypothetical protein FRB90_010984 [Tulasnella sp. 427]|nr:hypothetical protein FRB90_010984 [Tulasnella sp. 427]